MMLTVCFLIARAHFTIAAPWLTEATRSVKWSCFRGFRYILSTRQVKGLGRDEWQTHHTILPPPTSNFLSYDSVNPSVFSVLQLRGVCDSTQRATHTPDQAHRKKLFLLFLIFGTPTGPLHDTTTLLTVASLRRASSLIFVS